MMWEADLRCRACLSRLRKSHGDGRMPGHQGRNQREPSRAGISNATIIPTAVSTTAENTPKSTPRRNRARVGVGAGLSISLWLAKLFGPDRVAQLVEQRTFNP